MSYAVILSSDLCTDDFPENHGGDFTNNLNHSLDFSVDPESTWAVALKEVVYVPESWDNVHDGGNWFETSFFGFPIPKREYHFEGHVTGNWGQSTEVTAVDGLWYTYLNLTKNIFDENGCYTYENKEKWYKWKTKYPTARLPKYGFSRYGFEAYKSWTTRRSQIEPGLYGNANLVDELRKAILANVMQSIWEVPKPAQLWGEYGDFFKFSIKETGGEKKLSMHLDRIASPRAWEMFMKIRFSRELQFQLGFTDYISNDVGWIEVPGQMSGSPSNPIDVNRSTFHCLWVFCDIVKNSFVGEKRMPVLKLMPVSAFYENIHAETFGSPEFRPIATHNISTVRVWISNSHTGHPIKMNGTSSVKLVFERHGR
jgi:hypothetical protein